MTSRTHPQPDPQPPPPDPGPTPALPVRRRGRVPTTRGPTDRPARPGACLPNRTDQTSSDGENERDCLPAPAADPQPRDSAGVSAEAIAYWDDTCAALPPLDPAAVEAVAAVVRRIERRRTDPR